MTCDNVTVALNNNDIDHVRETKYLGVIRKLISKFGYCTVTVDENMLLKTFCTNLLSSLT